ncbi:MAG: S-adenosylmethionine decarboxylase [archaeon]
MFWGKLLTINLYECDEKLIKNEKEIKRFVKDLCDLIKMKRYGPTLVKRFGEGAIEGYSAMQFIETSSITIHFDEQENRAFIDIFSCKDFDSNKTGEFSKIFFKSKKVKIKTIIRK